MKRHHQILAAVLVVQILISVFVFWPKPAANAAGEPLFPDVEASDISSLTISDTDGNSVTLLRLLEGWTLPDAGDYPADEEKVQPLLEKIAAMTTARLVTRTRTSHKRLQVAEDDFARLIEFKTNDGSQHRLYIGSSPTYNATHVRVEGQDETYLAQDISTWEINATPNSWIDTAYVRIPKEEITTVVLENENGTFVFEKDEAGSWTMQGLSGDEVADGVQISTLVGRLASINMLRPLGKEELPEYGLDQPNAVVTVETTSGTTTLRIGAQDPEDDSYVMSSSESDYYVRIVAGVAEVFVEKERDDFLELPPTATPAAEETGEP